MDIAGNSANSSDSVVKQVQCLKFVAIGGTGGIGSDGILPFLWRLSRLEPPCDDSFMAEKEVLGDISA